MKDVCQLHQEIAASDSRCPPPPGARRREIPPPLLRTSPASNRARSEAQLRPVAGVGEPRLSTVHCALLPGAAPGLQYVRFKRMLMVPSFWFAEAKSGLRHVDTREVAGCQVARRRVHRCRVDGHRHLLWCEVYSEVRDDVRNEICW